MPNSKIARKFHQISLRIFGNKVNLIGGDTLVADRWLWLVRNLPRTNDDETVLDVGCGSGAFALEAALRGYESVGLSWDHHNQAKATERACALGVSGRTSFPVVDARTLDQWVGEHDRFNWIINFENIEHIIDDKKLFVDMSNLLKPGGRLLLTTPYLFYFPLSREDLGPFELVENGGHVRRGYTEQMLRELCDITGLRVERVEYCSGIASQFSTRILRFLTKIFGYRIGWTLTLPLRPLSFFIEALGLKGRGYSICLVAYKPRYLDRTLQSGLSPLSS